MKKGCPEGQPFFVFTIQTHYILYQFWTSLELTSTIHSKYRFHLLHKQHYLARLLLLFSSALRSFSCLRLPPNCTFLFLAFFS